MTAPGVIRVDVTGRVAMCGRMSVREHTNLFGPVGLDCVALLDCGTTSIRLNSHGLSHPVALTCIWNIFHMSTGLQLFVLLSSHGALYVISHMFALRTTRATKNNSRQ